jgi:hypothetical protein
VIEAAAAAAAANDTKMVIPTTLFHLPDLITIPVTDTTCHFNNNDISMHHLLPGTVDRHLLCKQ